jgi:putative MATE family efflux protein
MSSKLKKLDPNHEVPKASLLLRNTLKISLPAAAETFFIGLIGMADTIMVGGLENSRQALAAVALSQQPVMITLAASIGINAGVIAIISRRKGENKPQEANQCLRQSLIISTIISSFLTILALVFARPLLLLAGAKSDTIDLAMNYFQIVSLSLVFNYIRLAICSAQRAIGKTTITLVTNVTANVINVILNYCLIKGNFGFPKLGVSGAAIATVIGNFVAFVIAIISIYNRKGFLSVSIHDNWKIDTDSWGHIFGVSTPAFIEQLFMRIGFFGIAAIVNNLGTEQTAINAVISTIMGMSFNITDGFAIGASSLVGRSLGEKDQIKAFAYGRISQMASIFVAVFMMTITVVFRKNLAFIFTTDKTVVDEASRLLLYTAIIMLPQSVQWVTTGILRGAGDTKYTARSALISVVFIRPILSLTLVYPLGLGLIGSWIGMFVDQMVRWILNNRRFTSLKWTGIEV